MFHERRARAPPISPPLITLGLPPVIALVSYVRTPYHSVKYAFCNDRMLDVVSASAGSFI